MPIDDLEGLPKSMKVVEISKFGGPDVLTIAERELPIPNAGEVLIRVSAAGINRPDIMQRKGLYPPPPGASDIPGLEVAGEICAVGTGVGPDKLGQSVCALVSGGGYAEYCLAHIGHCLAVPHRLTMAEAAALPECVFTVWTNIFERGKLASGESILIHGGSSGIGTLAIQLASHFGARVFATAGSSDKCRVCEELGAEHAINYKKENYKQEMSRLLKDEGLDVILDMVGGDYIEQNLSLLRKNGRLVLIAFLGGSNVKLDLSPVLLKWLTITGSTLRPRTLVEKEAVARAVEQNVWPLVEAGKVNPIIYKKFPLFEAPKAHFLMETSEHIGKIVLQT